MKIKSIIFAIFFSSAVICAAQTSKPAPAPELTELQKTQLDLYKTKLDVLQGAANPYLSSIQKLKAELEKEHPGYTLDISSGTLILIPAQAKVAKPEDSKPYTGVTGPVVPPSPSTPVTPSSTTKK